MFYFFITSTYILAGVRYIIIQIFTFFLTLNINIYTTENINRLCNRFEIKGYIIIDINIQVTVQHRHCLLRSTVCVSRIGFLELLLLSLTGNIQIGVTIYRHQIYFMRIIVDIHQHDHITVAGLVNTLFTVVQTKTCNGSISFKCYLSFFGNLIFSNLCIIQFL